MSTLRERLVKIGAGIACQGRPVVCRMAEILVSRGLFIQPTIAN